jgi:hypothetical protein
MPSEFDILAAEFCSPAMVEQFGGRDAQGDFEKVIATPPGRQPIEIVGVILGSEETAQIELEGGNVEKRNTRYLTFPKQKELTVIEMKTKFEIGGRMWAVQLNGNRDDGNWLTYQLERKPLAQLDAKRDARTV